MFISRAVAARTQRYDGAVDILALCILVVALQVLAVLFMPREFYAVLRFVVPLLAIAIIIQLVDRNESTVWMVWFALSGLIFVPGDSLPRAVWFPINVAVIVLNVAYLGQTAWHTIVG